MIDRQVENRQVSQLLAPIRHLILEDIPHEPLPLPLREVAVLHGEFRQRRREAGGERAIQRRHFLAEHAERPAVRHDVMQRKEQDVVAVTDAVEAGTEQRASLQIEGSCRLLGNPQAGDGFPLGRGHIGQIVQRDIHCDVRCDHLHRLAVLHAERRAERFMPAHHFPDRLPHRRQVERSFEPSRARNVVERIAGDQLIEEPQAFLRERQWHRPAAIRSCDARGAASSDPGLDTRTAGPSAPSSAPST